MAPRRCERRQTHRFDRRARVVAWAAAALALAVADLCRAEPIRLGCADHFPPYVFLDAEGNPQGIYVDLFDLIGRRTGSEYRWVLKPWAKAFEAFDAGEMDALVGLTSTPERRRRFDFTDTLDEIPTYVYFHEGLQGIRGIQDLAGFPVGVMAQTSTEETLRREVLQALCRDSPASHLHRRGASG